ncbi:hypothetical protein [Georgenia thermotolerans]|uniref:ABC transporter permease n=1 Tax=Georgenia thermotolerans TaxID=527326 RepID=A0A7J5UPU4_9MICO|nr:hypothetical protein [Georgenia thermotolerans]KAE8764432.1 hypothetical protein GB883_09145 [Georgenia thermotolerans]
MSQDPRAAGGADATNEPNPAVTTPDGAAPAGADQPGGPDTRPVPAGGSAGRGDGAEVADAAPVEGTPVEGTSDHGEVAEHAEPTEARAAEGEDRAAEAQDRAAEGEDRAAESAAERAGVGRLVAVALVTTIAAVFAVVALVAPYLGTGPRNVPVGVAGEKSSTAQIEQLLTTLQPGAFHVKTYDDADALRAATLHREVYGGFAVDRSSSTAVVATGASPVLGQFLGNIGNSLGATVDDVAPGSAKDSTGYGLHVAATVAALAAVAGACVLARTGGRRLSTQLTGALALAVVLGIGVAAALQLLDSVAGAFLQVAAVTALAVLAVEVVVLALVRLGGLVAAGLFTLLIVVPGIGLSGLTSAPEMLPSPFGAIGQLLPQGAYGRLVQSVAYLGGGGALRPLLVLLAWLVLGALLLWLARAREAAADRRRGTEAHIAALEAEAVEDDGEATTVPGESATGTTARPATA